MVLGKLDKNMRKNETITPHIIHKNKLKIYQRFKC